MKKLIVLLGCILCTLQINAEHIATFHSNKLALGDNGKLQKSKTADISITLDTDYIYFEGTIGNDVSMTAYYKVTAMRSSETGAEIACRNKYDQTTYIFVDELYSHTVITVQVSGDSKFMMFILDGAL